MGPARSSLRRTARWRTVAVVAVAAAAGGLVAASPASAALPDRFGFAHYEGAAVPANASPAGTTVLVGGVGHYRVIFPGQAARGGVAHVTAVSSDARWCQIEGFGTSGADEVVGVRCFRPGGVPADSRFSVMFSSSSGPTAANGRYGYVDTSPAGAIISQYNSAGAANTVTPGPVGTWVVRMPGLVTAGPQAGSWQATAVSPQLPARCKVSAWASSPASGQAVRVLCFTAGGAPVNVRFTLTYQYQQSLYGPAFPPANFAYVWWTPPLGPPLTNFNSQAGPGFNTAVASGAGLVYVQFPRVGPRPDNVQVTAFGNGSEFCGLQYPWITSAGITHLRNVNCWTNAGLPANVGFLASYSSRL